MYWITVLLVSFLVYKVLDYLVRAFKVRDYSNKYVFITGCDTGFGEALAIRLDRLGFRVIAGCLTDTGKNSLQARTSSRFSALVVNVGDSDSIGRALDVVRRKVPESTGLWGVVNNAGISGPLACSEVCSQQDFARVMAVNLFGPIQICRSFMPLVRKARGRVVNMTSTCGFFASLGSAYPTSKFGLEGFTDSLRREVQDFGVKVSILEPGFFKTNIVNLHRLESAIEQAFAQADPEVKSAYGPDYIQSVMSSIKLANAAAPDDVRPVVDAYVHALVSRYPRTRYVIGRDAKVLMALGHLVPTGLADWGMWLMRSRVKAYVLAKKNK